MKSIIKLATLALLILVTNFSVALSWQAQCPDVMERGYLNVLTINVLFSEVENREDRLTNIADFIEEQEGKEEPIDVVLLQEVVGGPLSGTVNSALDLKNLLAERGLEYNLSYRLANGVPKILTVGNAILSRCKIVFTISKTLPFVTEEPFEGFEIPLRRKVMMSRVKIPGFGKINVYNTHLCAFCDPIEERLKQAKVLMDFIRDVEDFIWWDKNPVILGGDFNANLNNLGDIFVYALITHGRFIDTYATHNDCFSCCSEEKERFDGCTWGVPGNPYAFNPFTGEQEEPKRIDYIFIRGKKIRTQDSFVVFNSHPDWVSDHSGVLTKIKLLP
ncbi:endonuclease [bacterium]|nr:endonuclease [bacterium]NIO20958.1 endonuclease [Candidatus Aenigmarchaeota archaeon]NIO73291.1 endonuclease [bacterium]